MSKYLSSSSSSSSSSSDLEDIEAKDTELEMLSLILRRSYEILEACHQTYEVRRRRRFIRRNRGVGHTRLVNDYFSEIPVYSDDIFRRRFRMRRSLFLRLVNALENHSPYFQQRLDAAGNSGLSSLQKCTAAISQLAYGVSTNHLDKYLQMGESTAIKCLFKFCGYVIELFGAQYLRRQNADDAQRLLCMHEEKHDFPGMLGSLDCLHWEWKNCPVVWKYKFTREHGSPTIMLEAVASQDLWIWHAFFGIVGSRNDTKMLYDSHLFNNVLHENSTEVSFTVNDTRYTNGYYLTDEIYPEWATLVKTSPCVDDPKKRLFEERLKVAKKDVERAFEVLQARWSMVKGPTRLCYRKRMKNIMFTCIILHNMIVEDEGVEVTNWYDDENDDPLQYVGGPNQEFQDYLQRSFELLDNQVHHQLNADLTEHIWARCNRSQ